MIVQFSDIEAAAEKYGLRLTSYGDCFDTKSNNPDKYLAYAYFTNEYNRRRKKYKLLLARYYMERTEPGRDSFRATTLYSLEVEGIKTNDKKPFGGIFEGIASEI